MSQTHSGPILNLMQTRQLSGLLETVDQLTGDSTSKSHQPLATEIRSAVTRIERSTISANQNALVEELAKTFDRKRKAIFNALEPPLSAIQRLAESGYLQDAQKTNLLFQLARTYELLTEWDIAVDQYSHALDYCRDDENQKT